MNTDITQNLRSRIDELKTLRDEIRVDLHLAGMGLKDEWRELERRLPEPSQLGQELKTVTAEALDQILGEVRRFRQFLQTHAAGDSERPAHPLK